MRDEGGFSATEDLTLLLVAVLGFTLFFASLAASYVQRAASERGERLEALAGSLLSSVLKDARWARGHGLLDPAALGRASAADLRAFAAGHPFQVIVWNLQTGDRWTVQDGVTGGDWRTAATAANLVGARVDPARVSATVWGP